MLASLLSYVVVSMTPTGSGWTSSGNAFGGRRVGVQPTSTTKLANLIAREVMRRACQT
jgi:hypothetical protein